MKIDTSKGLSKTPTYPTLYDKIAASKDDVFTFAVGAFAGASELFAYLPFLPISGGCVTPETHDVPKIETLHICGGDCDVDKAMVKIHGPDSIRVLQHMKLKALGLHFADMFVNGDATANPRVFDGIDVRLNGQLRLTWDTNKTFCHELTKLARSVPGCVLLMSKANRRLMYEELRQGTADKCGVDWTKGAFGQNLVEFLFPLADDSDKLTRAPVIVMDYDDVGGKITDDDTVYAVRFGHDGVLGIDNGLEVTDFGEICCSPVHRLRFEFLVGLVLMRADAIKALTKAS